MFSFVNGIIMRMASGMDRGRVTGKGSVNVVSVTAYAVGEGYGC
jgi:hypothetical protein